MDKDPVRFKLDNVYLENQVAEKKGHWRKWKVWTPLLQKWQFIKNCRFTTLTLSPTSSILSLFSLCFWLWLTTAWWSDPLRGAYNHNTGIHSQLCDSWPVNLLTLTTPRPPLTCISQRFFCAPPSTRQICSSEPIGLQSPRPSGNWMPVHSMTPHQAVCCKSVRTGLQTACGTSAGIWSESASKRWNCTRPLSWSLPANLARSQSQHPAHHRWAIARLCKGSWKSCSRPASMPESIRCRLHAHALDHLKGSWQSGAPKSMSRSLCPRPWTIPWVRVRAQTRAKKRWSKTCQIESSKCCWNSAFTRKFW